MLILLVFVYHTWSWFKIMPKTLPTIFIGAAKLEQATITWIGVVAAVVVNLVVLVLLTGVKP